MLSTVAVIGTGNIGTRHLQAIVKCDEDIRLFAVDPSQEARENSVKMLSAADAGAVEKITYLESAELLPAEVEVAIVAVSSRIRRAVVEQLLAHASVKYMVLEKVLFPREEDYSAVGQLLKENCVRAWVNCARRSWPYTQTLRQYFNDAGPLTMSVSGNMWGLGCNTIHYMDLLSYLSNCAGPVSVDIGCLDEEIIPSKREGYVEFTGEMNIQIGPHHLKLTSSPGAFEGFTLDIESAARKCHITEVGAEGKNIVTDVISGQQREELFTVPFQSGLTTGVVSSLLRTGDCILSPYKDSAQLHIPMLRGFLKKLDNGTDYCNIT